MKLTLAGKFESALFRKISEHANPRMVDTEHNYYVGLLRETAPTYWERVATFVAVADEIAVPLVDWGISNDGGKDPELSLEQFGIKLDRSSMAERDADVDLFAQLLLACGAFSNETLESLKIAAARLEGRHFRHHPTPFGNLPAVDGFAHHHLVRILPQTAHSADVGAFLVVGEEEKRVLDEICKFVLAHELPTPFDVPDTNSTRIVEGHNFVGGLLNFSPPDAPSVAVLRDDKTVSRYAAQIRDAFDGNNAIEAQRKLLQAMRLAMEKKESASYAKKVFEVEGWICKPLQTVPGIGNILSGFEIVVEVVKRWMQRKQSENSWYLLGARMTELTVEDYLRRNGNQ